MHDGKKILGGLTAFFALALFPVWRPAITRPAPRPVLKIVTAEKRCVEPKETMRASHMALLNSWRDTVVRKAERTYRGEDGKTVTMSLSGTCMRCHPNKSEFCDACHNDLAVKPYCWDCHIEPKEKS
jgi:hypothetical protein